MSKDIVIELTRDHGTAVKGSRFGLPSVAVADRLYPSYKVVGHTDGSDYEAPATSKPPTRRKVAPKATAPATESTPVADVPAGDAT